MQAFGLALFGALVFAAGVARADKGGQPVGRWLTQDHDGVIEVFACGAAMCGRIVGMDSPFRADGRPELDMRGRPQCGLQILGPATATPDGNWHGRILNPRDGNMWRCEFWRVGDTLHLRGYLLIPLLGRTQVWTPFAGSVDANCRMS